MDASGVHLEFGKIFIHAFNRGIDRRQIFKNSANYRYFLATMTENLNKHPVRIVAYCLMLTHYHILARVDVPQALSKLIQNALNRYVQAYNKQEGRSGPLFDGKVKYRLVENAQDVFQIARYIHLNPVTAGMVERPQDWEFSNYREWIDFRSGQLVDRALIDEFFDAHGYEAYVLEARE
ncbi:MAG: transposase [Anaerolineae bacterium]|nr:transposase [Anaerolineae bacterium]